MTYVHGQVTEHGLCWQTLQVINNWPPTITSGSYSLGKTNSEEKLAEKYLSKIGTDEQVAKLGRACRKSLLCCLE